MERLIIEEKDKQVSKEHNELKNEKSEQIIKEHNELEEEKRKSFLS
ncbi:hypothetical protein [Clostridium botulinum]